MPEADRLRSDARVERVDRRADVADDRRLRFELGAFAPRAVGRDDAADAGRCGAHDPAPRFHRAQRRRLRVLCGAVARAEPRIVGGDREERRAGVAPLRPRCRRTPIPSRSARPRCVSGSICGPWPCVKLPISLTAGMARSHCGAGKNSANGTSCRFSTVASTLPLAIEDHRRVVEAALRVARRSCRRRSGSRCVSRARRTPLRAPVSRVMSVRITVSGHTTNAGCCAATASRHLRVALRREQARGIRCLDRLRDVALNRGDARGRRCEHARGPREPRADRDEHARLRRQRLPRDASAIASPQRPRYAATAATTNVRP